MESFSTLEIVAAALGVVNVALIVKQKVINYPFGIAMVVLYAVIFYDYKLYAESSLQIIWIFMQVYGWWFWLYGNKAARDAVPVTRTSRKWMGLSAGFVAAGTIGVGALLDGLTDAAVPFQDAFITMLSLSAQFLLDRKKLENWVLWIFVDVFSIGVYNARGLYLTMGLYVLFLGLAVSGLIAWQRSERETKRKAAEAVAAA